MTKLLLWVSLVCLYLGLDVVNFKILPFSSAYANFYKDAFTTSSNYVAALFVYTLYPLSILYLTKAVTLTETLKKAPSWA